MIHLYCGDGKGKTTAAMGLALRMAGHDQQVLIAQFLKGADSGERYALARLPQVTLLSLPQQVKFSFALTPEERQAEAERYQDMLAQVRTRLGLGGLGLLVLDEACAAVNTGLVPLADILTCLDLAGETEVALTGRDPAPELMKRADYITCFLKERHPFDRGVSARPGVEW
jgi:cob(I)alamin adenosyltransferase